jgi:type IV pilus assembly protein PilM
MMLNLLNRQTIELAGLDIGSSAVKLIQLEKTENGYTLTRAASEPIVPCADDQKQERQNRVDAIKACLKRSKSKHVVCGVSGPDVVVRGFRFPPIPDKAVEQAVRMEAQQVCPLDLNKSVLDFQLIQAAGQQSGTAMPRQGVMTVGTEKIVQEHTDLLTLAGVKPVMVDVHALALLNCLNELGLAEAQETVAVIDIGHTLSNVVVYGLDGLPFVRDINVAGQTIIQEMSGQLDLSDSQIQQLLRQGQVNEELDGNLLMALSYAVRPLLNSINETLRFYSFQEKKTGVDRILLCGGFALVDAFIEFLSDAVSIPVGLLNPLSHIVSGSEVSGNQLSEKDGPAFAVAAGLAMRTL